MTDEHSQPESAGTRREHEVLDGGTRRELTEIERHGTRREAPRPSDDLPQPSSSYGANQLLPSLQADYQFIEELPSGNEAQVLHCRSQTDDRDVLIKQYNKGIVPDVTALECLQRVHSDHVAVIYDHGADVSSGRYYEVQEWIPGGTLRTAINDPDIYDRIQLVIAELTSAARALHADNVVHRDLKPENILIRNRDTLDLVIADFGIARALQGTKRMTTVAGTIEYRPPESIHSAGLEVANRPSADWWSLGIIFAEIHLRRSFFALPDGTRRVDSTIEGDVRDGRLDFEQITDPALNMLCRGLCTSDPDERWGADEVELWLADPSDPALTVAATTKPSTWLVTAHFHGDHDNPVDLAAALQANWNQAAKELFDSRSPRLVEEVIAVAERHGITEVADMLSKGLDTQTRSSLGLTRLLLALDGELNPLYDGLDIRPAALRANAKRISKRQLADLAVDEPLIVWRQLPGMEGADEIQDRWSQERLAIRSIVESTPVLSEEHRILAEAEVFRFALNGRHFEKILRKNLKGNEDYRVARTNDAFAHLCRRGAGPAELALAYVAVEDVAANQRRSSPADVSTVTGSARLAAVITLLAVAGLGAYLYAEDYLAIDDLQERRFLFSMAGAVATLVVGIFLRRTVMIWWPVLAAGAAALLISDPLVWDGFFVNETTASQLSAGILLAPALGFFVAVAQRVVPRPLLTVPLALVGGLLTFAAISNGPMTSMVERIDEARGSAGTTTTTVVPTTATTDQGRTSPTETNPPVAPAALDTRAPCYLAQLATFDTEVGAMNAAAAIGAASGPSAWVPGWSQGRWVLFKPFANKAEAAEFVRNAAPAYDGVVVELPGGGDACGA